MFNIRQLALLIFLLATPEVGFSQTTYSSTPDLDVFTSCPQLDFELCSGFYIHGDGVLKLKLDDITNSHFVFQIKKCNGTFSTSGTAWIKRDGVCGTVVGGPVTYTAGASMITINVPIPSNFCNSTKNYYAMIHVNNGNNEGYYAGPVSITATSPLSHLEFTNCFNAPTSVKMYDNLNVTYALKNEGCSSWGGVLKTYIAQNNNGSNFQILSSAAHSIGPDESLSISTGSDQINLIPGNYSIVSVYTNGPNGDFDNPEANNCSPTTTNSYGTITHYFPITIEPPCSENAFINITSPDPGDVFYDDPIQITWTDNVSYSCQVKVLYKIDNGSWQYVNGNSSIPNTGSVTWHFSNIISNNVRVRVELTAPTSTGEIIQDEIGPFSIYTSLNPPEQLAPADDIVLNPGTNSVTFSWDKSNPDGAATYELKIRDLDEDEVILNYFNVGDTAQYTYTNTNTLIDGHEYRWVVRAINLFYNAELGERTFEIGDFGLQHSSPLSFGESILYSGNQYNFTTVVENLGTGTWSGNLYLKINDWSPAENLGSYSIPGNGGEQNILYSFTPTSNHVGDQVAAEFRFQTNGSNDSYLMGSFLHINPIYIDIVNSSLDIISPNGGEIFQSGSAIPPITWTSSGGIEYVSLSLITTTGSHLYDIAINTNNDGQIPPWTIPSNVAPGEYKVKICRYPNGPECDESNSTFSIQNPNSFDLQLLNGINTIPISLITGHNAEFNAEVINVGNVSFSGTLQMVLLNNLGIEITPLVTNESIVLAENESYLLTHQSIPITSPAGTYQILIRWKENANDPWQPVNSSIYLNPKTITILETSGNCTITNPPATNQESYEAAQYLCQNGVIQQPVNGDVHPEDSIIKEDLAKVVFLCLFGFDPNAPTPADNFPVPFVDMQDQENQAYARYGKVLSYLEYGDGISPFYRRFFNYNPGSTLTRGQVCKVIIEAFNFNKDVFFVPFADVPSAHPEFLHIAKCAELGIVNGHTGNFNPDQNATREQVFIMLHRLMTQCPECEIPEPEAEDFFNPGNYTPANLGRYLSVSDANFDQYNKSSFVIPGRNLPLVFAHNYNSFLTELPEELFCVWYNDQWVSFRPLGPGWSHSYNGYIVKIDGWTHPNGTTQPDRIAIFWPGGTIHVYEQVGNNLTAITKGLYDDIVYDVGTDTYVITKNNQIKYRFEQRNSANPDWPYVMTQIEDRNNNKIQLSYEDYAGGGIRLKEVFGTNSKKLSFSYYPNTCRIYEVKDPLNRKVQFAHGGPTGQDLASYKFFEGAIPLTTTYNYFSDDGGKHLLKIITLPNGNFINNTYYQRKLLSTTSNGPNGALSSQEVNWGLDGVPSGETSSSVNIFDGSRTYTYNYETNGQGKTTHMSTPTNELEQAQYSDPLNPTLPTSVTIDGITTQYEYDANGNVTKITQPLGVEHEFTYTALNDIETYTNPRNFSTTFDYEEGNLTLVAAPIGSTTMSYNSFGQVETVTNPEGITVSYEYDATGLVKSVNGPLGISSHATYDPVGRLQISEDPNGHISTYTYYDRDFIKTIADPMGYVTQYAYDNNGNLTDVTNSKGNITHIEYDYFDWLKSVEFEGDKKSYFYDLEGKLMKTKKPDGKFLQYAYHSDGNLKSNGYASFTFDPQNRLKTVTKDGETLTYGYDNLHRITSTSYDGSIVQYEYDHNNNVTKVIYPGTGKEVDYTYDANDRLKTVEDWIGNKTEYFYLDDGRIEHVDYPNGVITEYFYDSAGRMDSSVTRHGSEIITAYGYVLAPNGNHLVERKTEPLPEPELQTTTITNTYNEDNTIATSGSNTYSFNDNGNLVTEAERTYSWDSHDMLIGIQGDVTATYAYDGLGHRRSSIVNGVGKKYVLDILGMSQVLLETNLNGDPENYYVYGLGLISRIKPDNSTRYYHGDFRGSTVAITNESGQITHSYRYLPFGEVCNEEEEDENTFQFVGMHGVQREMDYLYFMRARYYNAEIGRFLSEDPVRSENLFTYTANNPFINIDPLGESDFPAIIYASASLGAIKGGLGAAIESTIYTAYSLKYAFNGDIQTASTFATMSNHTLLKAWHPIEGEIVNGFIEGGIDGAISSVETIGLLYDVIKPVAKSIARGDGINTIGNEVGKAVTSTATGEIIEKLISNSVLGWSLSELAKETINLLFDYQ